MFNRLKQKTKLSNEIKELIQSIESSGGSPEYALKMLDRELKILNHTSPSLISCIGCVGQRHCSLKANYIDELITMTGRDLSTDTKPLFDNDLYVQAALKCISFDPIKDNIFHK